MSIISVQDLAKSYGKIEAVKGVSFDVEAGEIFGFLGPNGAGKTTTINMLCTLVKPGGGAERRSTVTTSSVRRTMSAAPSVSSSKTRRSTTT